MEISKKFIVFLIIFLILNPILAEASSWPAFGKDQTRVRVAVDQQAMPPLYKKWEVRNLGWSISSPVTDGTYIYHVAGGYFYRIPLNMDFVREPMTLSYFQNMGVDRMQISDDPHVASHPTYDHFRDRIYVGNGDGQIVRIRLSEWRIDKWYNTGYRVVAAPTVLGDDLVSFTTGDRARLVISKGNNYIAYNFGNSPMEITGTMAVKETSTGPIIFVPINYKGQNRSGFVDAIRVTDNGSGNPPSLQFVWSRPFQTDNGVAASIVYDESRDRIYFADKSGSVYAVDATTGKQVWKNSVYQSGDSVTTLVNNSPALYGNTLVIPFRYANGRNKGQIAAYDVRNGQLLWTRTSAGETRASGKYEGEISSAPVIISEKGKQVVIYGNTRGVLRAVKLSNGSPVPVAKYGNQELYSVSFVGGTPGSIYQGQGIATEIMVANGHIVFGANNGSTPNASGTNGNLYAFSTDEFAFMVPINLTGRVHSQVKIPLGAPLPVFFGPWNIGTEDIDDPFTVRLYVNNIMVREKRFNGLKSGDIIGEWYTVPAQIASNSLGQKEIRLEVDYYNEIDEPIKSDNVLYHYYEVVYGEPPPCPGGEWENGICIKKWTEHYIHENRTRAVLIR